jgi:hypothetical protein
MKKLAYLFLILCCYGLFFNCKKEDGARNENYTDLKDTIIKIPDGLMIGSTNFDLDIDKDNTIDLSILVVKYYSSMYPWSNYVQISPKNGYQLNYSNYVDTSWYWNPTLPAKVFQYEKAIIPKIFNTGDTIKIEGDFTNDSTKIAYNENPGGANSQYYGGIYMKAWVNIGYKYIALRQRKETVNKLAWIKLKVNSSSVIVLNSCYYIENKEELIIEKQ